MDSQEKKYVPLTKEQLNYRAKEIENLWIDFLKSQKCSDIEYHIHKQRLFEVIKRQHERLFYYNIFHDLKYPCEYKFLAIECFWIITLKPFYVLSEKCNIYDAPNEKFSLFLIIAMIREIFENKIDKSPDEVFVYPSKDRQFDILYDFKYCSLSREAMISFVETFADIYGVGIEYILKNGERIAEQLKNATPTKAWGNNESSS